MTLEKPETLLPVFALINRIRLCASRKVLAEAERLLGRITDQYFAKNLTVEELRKLAHTREGRSAERLRRGLPRGAQVASRGDVKPNPDETPTFR